MDRGAFQTRQNTSFVTKIKNVPSAQRVIVLEPKATMSPRFFHTGHQRRTEISR